MNWFGYLYWIVYFAENLVSKTQNVCSLLHTCGQHRLRLFLVDFKISPPPFYLSKLSHILFIHPYHVWVVGCMLFIYFISQMKFNLIFCDPLFRLLLSIINKHILSLWKINIKIERIKENRNR